MRLLRTSVAGASCLLLGACTEVSSGAPASTSAAPQTSSTAAGWNPCDALDAGGLTALGLDPGYTKPYSGQLGKASESGCTYRAAGTLPAYTADVGYSNRPVDDILSSPTLRAQPDTVGGRRATQFHLGTSDIDCSVAVELPSGSAITTVVANGSTDGAATSCPEARRVAEAILPGLP